MCNGDDDDNNFNTYISTSNTKKEEAGFSNDVNF